MLQQLYRYMRLLYFLLVARFLPFAIFWPFAGQPGDRCLCEAGIPGALILNAMVFKNI